MDEYIKFKKKKRILRIIFISLFFFTLTIILSLLIVFYILYHQKKNIRRNPLFEYQYQEIDTRKKVTSNGFLSLVQELSEDEHMSYTSEKNGNYIIISNLGGTRRKYACTGRCFCSDSEDIRRRTGVSVVLKRGLFVLLSALSIMMALKMSEEFFRVDCIQKYTSENDNDNDICQHIESEVEECIPVSDISNETPPNVLVDSEDSEEDYDDDQRKEKDGLCIFVCRGYCIDRNNPYYTTETNDDLDEQAQQALKVIGLTIDCLEIRLTNELVYDPTTFYLEQNKDGDEEHDKNENRCRQSDAIEIFTKDHLDPYCRHSSRIEYRKEYFEKQVRSFPKRKEALGVVHKCRAATVTDIWPNCELKEEAFLPYHQFIGYDKSIDAWSNDDWKEKKDSY